MNAAARLGACLALALIPAAATAQKAGKKYALVVGVNDYDHRDLAPLKYAENDAEKLARVLRDNGFAEVRLLTRTQGNKDRKNLPTAQNIRQALADLLGEKTRRDTVLIALSGHGVQVEVEDPDGKGGPKTHPFFCPSDADFVGISYSTGKAKRLINLNDLFDDLGKCGAGSRLALMDACRNELKARGATRSVADARVSIPEGVGVLFSCARGEKAWEAEDLGHGVFFHFVLEGLLGKAANDEGTVNWDDLGSYVKRHVSRQVGKIIGGGARQSPHSMGSLVGESPVLTRGFASLFNGKNLTGWKAPGKSIDSWDVKGGHLVSSGPASHLFTERGDYKNFHLRVEAKVNDGGNGGVYFRARYSPGFPIGWEAQVNATHKDPIKTGSLFPAARLGDDLERIKQRLIVTEAGHEADEWFTLEVICRGNHITILVNGKKTIDWKDPKNRLGKGHLALQHHDPGTRLTVRKIEVKELTDE